MDVRLKRAYEQPAPSDGYRVLIDRLWPRGVSKEEAQLDEWARELAPSSELRRWFGHDPAKFDEFRRRYREGCDVLLLDDVQFLAGKESSQDEFFHTFNSLYENHKQIVVTSDRYPHEIQGLEERLKTRLQWGLVADLKAPDLAMRLDLLQDKAQAHGVDLPLDVANYLATQCAQSVRELEGALLRLQAFASITREPLSLAQAREHLSPMLASQAAPVTLARVTEVVATYYGLKPVDVRGPSRQRQIARARQVSMFLIRTHLKASLPEIGRFFGGRDHTTALSSIRKIDGLTKTDVSMQAVVARLSQSLFAG
jgi:chromosomal replication initiator protein